MPLFSESVVHVEWRQEAEPRVPVLLVVPVEEHLAVRSRMLDGTESLGEIGPVLQRLELRLGIWIVVRDVRP